MVNPDTEWDNTPTCNNWGHTSAGQQPNPNCRCRMCLRALLDTTTSKAPKKK